MLPRVGLSMLFTPSVASRDSSPTPAPLRRRPEDRREVGMPVLLRELPQRHPMQWRKRFQMPLPLRDGPHAGPRASEEEFLVRPGRFELPTFCSGGKRTPLCFQRLACHLWRLSGQKLAFSPRIIAQTLSSCGRSSPSSAHPNGRLSPASRRAPPGSHAPARSEYACTARSARARLCPIISFRSPMDIFSPSANVANVRRRSCQLSHGMSNFLPAGFR